MQYISEDAKKNSQQNLDLRKVVGASTQPLSHQSLAQISDLYKGVWKPSTLPSYHRYVEEKKITSW